jgi:hypothetical protein
MVDKNNWEKSISHNLHTEIDEDFIYIYSLSIHDK